MISIYWTCDCFHEFQFAFIHLKEWSKISSTYLYLSRHYILVRFHVFKSADIQNNTLRIFQDYYLLNQFIYPAWIVLSSWFSWHRHSCNNFKLIYFTNDMKTLLLNINFLENCCCLNFKLCFQCLLQIPNVSFNI